MTKGKTCKGCAYMLTICKDGKVIGWCCELSDVPTTEDSEACTEFGWDECEREDGKITGRDLFSQDEIDKVIEDIKPYWRDDAISRQAAIDAFSMFAEYESNRTNAEWVDRIRVVLSSLPPVQPISRWIPVSEIAPDEDFGEVLGCDDRGEMLIGYLYADDDYESGYCLEEDGIYLCNVVAWMPKPAPFKAESEDKE